VRARFRVQVQADENRRFRQQGERHISPFMCWPTSGKASNGSLNGQTPCHQREGVDFKPHVESRASVSAHPFSLTVICESNKIRAQTAFITKGVIENDAIIMYIVALIRLLSRILKPELELTPFIISLRSRYQTNVFARDMESFSPTNTG